MKQKLESLGESSLRNFTLNQPTYSVYDFEGEDYRLVMSIQKFYLIKFGLFNACVEVFESSFKECLRGKENKTNCCEFQCKEDGCK